MEGKSRGGGASSLPTTSKRSLLGRTARKDPVTRRAPIIPFSTGSPPLPISFGRRAGGFKKKHELTKSPFPFRPVDGYHSCYNLSGLGAGQYRYSHVPATSSPHGFSSPLSAGFNWVAEDAEEEGRVWDEEDRVGKVHPVYALPWGRAEEARRWFENKVGF